jgi:putative MATE family efflux protein
MVSESVLSAMLSSPDVLEAALKYLDLRIYGIFFAVVSVMFRAFYVGTTNTKALSLNALVMALLNVFFDYTLIFGNWGFPAMGIAGAALASVIAEASAVAFLIIYTCCVVDLKKYGFKSLSLGNWRVIKNILNVSLSLMLQYFLALATWLFFFLAIERMGEQPLAISNIVRSIYMLLSIPVMALAATSSTLVSNIIGAGKHKEALPLIWKIARLSLGIVGSFVALIALFPRLILSIYTPDADLVTASLPSLYVVLAVLPIVAIGYIFFNSVSGTGNTRKALLIEVIALVIYVGYMWLVVVFLKAPLAVCWTTEIVYSGLIFLLSYLYLRYGKWAQRKI